MRNKETAVFQEVDWQAVRLEVKAKNPELANIIDEINPNKHYKLVKAVYSFGDLIVQNGLLYLPAQTGKLLPITDENIDKKIKEKLSYSPIPLVLLLDKSSEVFINESNRVIPLNVLNAGNLFGTFETLDFMFNQKSHPVWNVSAGARSIFMLPRITEASGFKRLRAEYGLSSDTRLKYLADHWAVFAQIANCPNFNEQWRSQALIFPKEWFANSQDPAWLKFQRYVFKQGWLQSQYNITKIDFGLLWQACIKAITGRNLKPVSYLSDTLKHLLAISMQSAPAFTPAGQSQLAAPINGLQQVFINTYLLKDYLPTILYPAMLNSHKNTVGYYSLALPTLLEGSPINKNLSTLMLDIKYIKLMIDTALRAIGHDNDFINKIQFNYFHVEHDKLAEIQSSKIIPASDPAFLQETEYFNNRTFCATSPFWRGCIKIAIKS
jgi:hypothetical protein